MAPFKLRFAKMSKSRSKESSSSSSSTECDETGHHTPQITADNLKTSKNSEIDVVAASADFRNNFSHSPPPSYEHVLDEKRIRVSTSKVINTKGTRNDDNGKSISNIPMADSRIFDESRQEESCLVMRGGKLTINGPEILHKSSKELYRAVAKQCGITCKMSDHCRCIDCQSHYFDCDYEKDEQGKTDGGLSAGTPMFISEAVMHGTACILL